jgi:ferric-dicitrate binding protein FerR (iron transport regulator)
MSERIIEIANRFISEKECSRQELIEMKNWLSNSGTKLEVEQWLADHWTISSEIESNVLLENVFIQIQEYQDKNRSKSIFTGKRVLQMYQRVAAVLLIPLIGLGILYWVSYSSQLTSQYTETIAPRGQKSQIVLVDGTKVWLNSDTKIRYKGNFNNDQRDVYLDGEAFFEVTKNAHRPFIVHTTGISIKVLGTKFNVKAYSDEDLVETSLFEGNISLLMTNPNSKAVAVKEVKPGQSFLYSKTNRELESNRFSQEEICGWKKNQLIFKDDTFSNLVKKVERWYDVQVVYDEKLFKDRRLTLELNEGERLEQLMKIVSLALSVDYQYDNEKIILTPKKKNI